MGRDSANELARTEDKRLDGLPSSAKSAVKKLDGPLDEAKKRGGRAVRAAVGDNPIRIYADEGLMSRVMAGPGLPDWFARILNDDDATVRYALSLLRDVPSVRIRTTVDLEEKVG